MQITKVQVNSNGQYRTTIPKAFFELRSGDNIVWELNNLNQITVRKK